MTSFKDITGKLDEIKRYSQQIAAQQFLPVFLEIVNDLLFVISPEGNWALLSNSWNEELGWNIKNKLGNHFIDSIYPADRQRTGMAFCSYNLNESAKKGEYFNRYLKSDGSYCWVCYNKLSTKTGFILGAARIIKDQALITILENGDFDNGNNTKFSTAL